MQLSLQIEMPNGLREPSLESRLLQSLIDCLFTDDVHKLPYHVALEVCMIFREAVTLSLGPIVLVVLTEDGV